jgi:hypothetical protein
MKGADEDFLGVVEIAIRVTKSRKLRLASTPGGQKNV